MTDENPTPFVLTDETRGKVELARAVGLGDEMFLDEIETGALCGFSSYTLRGWRLKGEGKGPKSTLIHGSIRYRLRDVREWLDQYTSSKSARAPRRMKRAKPEPQF